MDNLMIRCEEEHFKASVNVVEAHKKIQEYDRERGQIIDQMALAEGRYESANMSLGVARHSKILKAEQGGSDYIFKANVFDARHPGHKDGVGREANLVWGGAPRHVVAWSTGKTRFEFTERQEAMLGDCAESFWDQIEFKNPHKRMFRRDGRFAPWFDKDNVEREITNYAWCVEAPTRFDPGQPNRWPDPPRATSADGSDRSYYHPLNAPRLNYPAQLH